MSEKMFFAVTETCTSTLLTTFDKDLMYENLKVDQEYRTILVRNDRHAGSAFGASIATNGIQYHWKMKIEKSKMHLDIII